MVVQWIQKATTTWKGVPNPHTVRWDGETADGRKTQKSHKTVPGPKDGGSERRCIRRVYNVAPRHRIGNWVVAIFMSRRAYSFFARRNILAIRISDGLLGHV